ncbi:MAG: TIGR02757 family protein [Bacteroidales bacterium]|nr:TIGR02757 family protein [Bacteroidales bacterium]MBN2756016.1 TIGR02757 family protein [Bacteroidales bacterium]
MVLSQKELKEFLDEKYYQYNNVDFIETDPIQIPHSFTLKEDIEISAFLSATIAWGNRKMIIRNAKKMMSLIDNSPFDFILNSTIKDINAIDNFVHRTFNVVDFQFFIKSLKNIYKNHDGLENVFSNNFTDVKSAIAKFRKVFFEIQYPERTGRHVSNVEKNSAAKRINMFLMWMVRNDNRGVHFGLWNKIKSADLFLPLDVHTGNVSRKLGLLTRKQSDWKAVDEITANLRKFDEKDPVKYDFALFGLGVFEKF